MGESREKRRGKERRGEKRREKERRGEKRREEERRGEKRREEERRGEKRREEERRKFWKSSHERSNAPTGADSTSPQANPKAEASEWCQKRLEMAESLSTRDSRQLRRQY